MWTHYRDAIHQTFAAALSPTDAEMLTAMLKGIIRHLRSGEAESAPGP